MIEDGLPKWKRDLPPFPHKILNDASTLLGEFYKEHIRRDIRDGKLEPPTFWLLVRGLLVAAMQTYRSTCILLSKKQPKPLMLQATILARSMFETLSTVLALMENPAERSTLLILETVKMYGMEFTRLTARYGNDPNWKDYNQGRRHSTLGQISPATFERRATQAA